MKCKNVFHAQNTACGECLETLETAAAAVVAAWRNEHRDPNYGAMSAAMRALEALLTPPPVAPAAASPRRRAKRA